MKRSLLLLFLLFSVAVGQELEMLGHWTFDEEDGDTMVHSEMEGDFSAAIENVVRIDDGVDGRALRIQGHQNIVIDSEEVKFLGLGENDADFSVTFWLRSKNVDDGKFHPILRKGLGYKRTFFIAESFVSGSLHARISTREHWNEGVGITKGKVSKEEWTHVAYVKSGNRLSVYINGLEDPGSVTLTGKSIANDGAITIGAYPWEEASNFDLDDLRIYRGALTEFELSQEVYKDENKNGVPEKLENNVLLRWNFNEAEGNYAFSSIDQTKAGFHGGGWIENGFQGSAATFKSNDTVYVHPNATLNSIGDSKELTVAFWIRPHEQRSETYRSIIFKGAKPSERTFSVGLAANALSVRTFVSTETKPWNGIEHSLNELDLNKWNHIAYVITKKGEHHLYLNGKHAETLQLEEAISFNDGPIYIGKTAFQRGVAMDFDELVIFDKGLHQLAVSALANVSFDNDPVPDSLEWNTYGSVDNTKYLNGYDQDNNGLIDDWENQYFGNQIGLAMRDNDQDGIINYLESYFQTDPTDKFNHSVPGYVDYQRWNNTVNYSVRELYQQDRVYTLPDREYYSSEVASDHDSFYDEFYTVRRRGYITPEESGVYRFWVSGATSASLWLSEDGTKFKKKKIAEIAPELGTGHGVPSRVYHKNYWDVFSFQMSDDVVLESGKKYFFETLMQHGHFTGSHVSVAWAGPNRTRQLLPSHVVSSFGFYDPLDLDDDYLPDAWELEYGLNPIDNGYINRLGQGEYGDFDRDGLLNHEEFMIGTNPSSSDTDGDGVSDRDELHEYRTNPLVVDNLQEQKIDQLDLTNYDSFSGWNQTKNGILAESSKESLTWELDIPYDGIWVIKLSARMYASLGFRDVEFPISILWDSILSENRNILLDNSAVSDFNFFTPFLSKGKHTLTLELNDFIGRRQLEVLGLTLVKPGGLDINQDGQADWLNESLAKQNFVAEHVLYSHVSPFFIEGEARSLSHVDISYKTMGQATDKRVNEEQWQNRRSRMLHRINRYEERLNKQFSKGLDNRMEGDKLTTELGVDNTSWYAYMPLTKNQGTGYVFFAENLGVSQTGMAIWAPLNVFDGQDIMMPLGSDLLLGGWLSKWDKSSITITVGGVEYNLKANETITYHFDQAGDYQVQVTHQNGQFEEITVSVKTANFGANPINLGEDRWEEVQLPYVGSDLVLDATSSVSIRNVEAVGASGVRADLNATERGSYNLLARLQPEGPILATGEINVVSVSGAFRNGETTFVATDFPGYKLINSLLLVDNIPPGGQVKVVIFRAGVTFLDGTTIKYFSEEDFENGMIDIQILKPEALAGGYCHYIDVLDAEGVLIIRQ